jgi:hypothetical protein
MRWKIMNDWKAEALKEEENRKTCGQVQSSNWLTQLSVQSDVIKTSSAVTEKCTY